MGFSFPMGFLRESHRHGITNMPTMGIEMGRVHVTTGMGVATLSSVSKFLMVDLMRM